VSARLSVFWFGSKSTPVLYFAYDTALVQVQQVLLIASMMRTIYISMYWPRPGYAGRVGHEAPADGGTRTACRARRSALSIVLGQANASWVLCPELDTLRESCSNRDKSARATVVCPRRYNYVDSVITPPSLHHPPSCIHDVQLPRSDHRRTIALTGHALCRLPSRHGKFHSLLHGANMRGRWCDI
jgi:hypothetical protein